MLCLAHDVNLAPALDRRGLLDKIPRGLGALLEVVLRKIADQTVELGARLGVPADIHQEPYTPLALVEIGLLDPSEQARDDRARHLAGRKPALPEPVNASDPDGMRADFDDRLLHADRFRPRALVAKGPPAALIPWPRLDADDVLGHLAGVYGHGLDELKLLPVRNALLASIFWIFEITDDDPLELVGDVYQRVIAVGRTDAPVNNSAFHDHRIGNAITGEAEKQEAEAGEDANHWGPRAIAMPRHDRCPLD